MVMIVGHVLYKAFCFTFYLVPVPPSSLEFSSVTNKGFRVDWNSGPSEGSADDYTILLRKIDPDMTVTKSTDKRFYNFTKDKDDIIEGGKTYIVQVNSVFKGKSSNVIEKKVTLGKLLIYMENYIRASKEPYISFKFI